ncbi:SDR family NAD(P)-dependent oxidoreductase [Candidatus Gottesmanbacteria bacterium]|nr:SDR family NAD(P)-dependent oxidoreductase [Candidatus Gottesmanbacteria bacterium]
MKKSILITGGAGFIGSNLTYYFLKKGAEVTIFDNFKRLGTRANLAWLKESDPKINVIEADIRDKNDVSKAVKGKDIIFHLAAQVAVTTSVTDPETDFEINARGTFNLLEEVRLLSKKPIIIFASTNKVYGGMEDIRIQETKTRYQYRDYPQGISETMCLDFHSPYGCSKGAADQYMRDYFRIYNIPTVVFRQSCIYGPRQFGVEDQGWIAWFIIALTMGKQITVYGDGKQVRDVLYIDDLVRLFELAVDNIEKVKGEIVNVGGGYKNTLAVWTEFGPLLEKLFDRSIEVKWADWRPGDQKVYVSNISKVEKMLGWSPQISVQKGVAMLYNWIQDNKNLFSHI